MSLSDYDVRDILRLIDESDLDELRLETPGLSLYVRRRGATAAVDVTHDEQTTALPPAPSPAPRPAAVDPRPLQVLVDVTAPMLGTFYRSDAPGTEPFVDIGAQIEANSVLCLIEVMKLMHYVQSGTAGVIREICAEDGQLVEFGQPLFRIDSD
jgi:acetyl-CoA carboxylase biotin carboxyl carrier protein